MAKYVSNVSLKVRVEPSLTSKTVGWYSKGDAVTVSETNGLWAKTSKGWVKKSYLTNVEVDKAVETAQTQVPKAKSESKFETKKKAIKSEEEIAKETAEAVSKDTAIHSTEPSPVLVESSPAAEGSVSEVGGTSTSAEVASAETAGSGMAASNWGWLALGAAAVGGGIALAAGSGSSDSDSTPVSATYSGYLIDSAVKGVSYTTTSGLSGVTDANGKFSYKAGDIVTFKVGNVTIGAIEVPADGVVLPQDLAGVARTEVTNPDVVKIAQFLQTLDSDAFTDGIQITTIDDLVNDSTIVDWSTVVVSTLFDGGTLVTEAEAIAHLNETMTTTDYIPGDATFDAIADAAPTALNLATADDTGVNTDNITQTTTGLTIDGVAVTDSSVQLYKWVDAGVLDGLVDDAELTTLGSAVTAASNAFSIDVALAEGTHKIVAKQTDVAGNLSEASDVMTITVDTTAPILSTKTVNATTLTIATDSVLGGTPLTSEFDVTIGSITLTPTTDYTIALDAENIVITLVTPITRFDQVKVAYTGTSVTDVAGNALATFTSSAVINETPSGIDSTVTAFAFHEPSHSIVLTGTDLDKVLDMGNGELLNTTDVTSRLNWTNFDWLVDGVTKVDIASTDIVSAYVNNSTTLTITLTTNKWDSLVSTYGSSAAANLLLSNATQDNIEITAGFLVDADGTAATTDAQNLAFVATQFLGAIPTTDIYSSAVTLQGAGSFDASLLQNNSGTYLVFEGMGDVGLSNIGSNIGVLQSDKTSGEITITGWDSLADVNMTIWNTDVGSIKVLIDNYGGGLINGATITNLELMGDNVNVQFDDATAALMLSMGSQTLEYIGFEVAPTVGLTVSGFTTAEDFIQLDNGTLISLLDGDLDGILDSGFESGAGDVFTNNTTFLRYNESNGQLLYDADGSDGISGALLLLTLTDHNNTALIANSDFKII